MNILSNCSILAGKDLTIDRELYFCFIFILFRELDFDSFFFMLSLVIGELAGLVPSCITLPQSCKLSCSFLYYIIIIDADRLKQSYEVHLRPALQPWCFFLLTWQVFGIDLVELEDKQKGNYILVNALETDATNPHLQW